MPRRASARITLVLIGSAAAVGCAPSTPPLPTEAVRDHYASAAECAVDWGAPEYCERVEGSPTGGTGGGVYFFRGPSYFPGTRDQLQQNIRNFAGKPAQPPTNTAIGRSTMPVPAGTTARGGFGSSSRSFSVGS